MWCWRTPCPTDAGDRPFDLLGIILHNVMPNAVKHAPGSRVRISADELPHGFRLVITDSGPGMSAASLDHINALLAGHGHSTELRSGLGYMIIATWPACWAVSLP